MNTRERMLVMIILAAIIMGGGVLFILEGLVKPIRARNASIALLKQEVDKKRSEVQLIQAELPKLARWRQTSLPADSDLARREYEKFLTDLLRRSKFAPGASSVTPKPADTRSSPTLPGKKEPIYTKLSFNVLTHGELSSLVTFLERFYRTGLLHQIKSFSIQRPFTTGASQRPNELDINLTIEALVLAGAENRPYLTPVDEQLLVLDAVASLRRGPGGLTLAAAATGPAGPLGARQLNSPPRQYASILGKNIFFGRPPAPTLDKSPVDNTDVTQFVYLTDITHSDKRTEAFLIDRYNDHRTRLRASTGFNTFLISDAQGHPLLKGQVIRIDDRDVIFKANDKHYALHVGASVKEALAKPLKDEELKNLGILPGFEKLPPPKETKVKPEPGP
jgi:hypothetical protein